MLSRRTALTTAMVVVWGLYVSHCIYRDISQLVPNQYPMQQPIGFRYTRSICNPDILRRLLAEVDISNMTSNDTACPLQNQFLKNDIYYMNVLSAETSSLPKYYKESIHPLHIDLETLVSEHLINGTAFPVDPINRHPYTYVHRPPDCDFLTRDNITVMILVKSYVKHTAQRYAIRETWAVPHLHSNVKIAFLLAGCSRKFQSYVDSESDEYHDVIQEDFRDNYRNNTIKTIMGFNWVTSSCSNASHVLFVDDDHLIHVKNILAYLRSFSAENAKNLYTGYVITKGQVNKDIREPWGIPQSDYPYPTWPPYLRGGAYIVSQEVAEKFATAFPYVKRLPVDDAYLGIVANKLGISALHDKRFQMKREYLHRYRNTYFSFNDYKSRGVLVDAWQAISLPASSNRVHIRAFKHPG